MDNPKKNLMAQKPRRIAVYFHRAIARTRAVVWKLRHGASLGSWKPVPLEIGHVAIVGGYIAEGLGGLKRMVGLTS